MKYAHLLLAIMLLGMGSSMAYADVPPPPPGGYAGGVFSQYFKNIADSSLGGSSNGLCPSGYGVVGFRSNSDSTFATPICNSVGMAGGTEGQTFVYSGGTWRGTSNIFHLGGRVGIGTTNPDGILHLSGSRDNIIDFQSTDNTWLYSQWKDNTGTRRAWMGLGQTLDTFNVGMDVGTTAFNVWNWEGSTSNLFNVQRTTGNVGIGAINPSSILEAYSTAAPTFRMKTNNNASNGVQFGFITGGSKDSEIWNWENGYFRIGTNNAERMRIDSSGNVGIGISPSTSRLHVSGNGGSTLLLQGNRPTGDNYLMFNNNGTNLGYLGYGSSSNNGLNLVNYQNDKLSLGTNSQEMLWIQPTGNVGIGTNNPGAKLDVNGIMRAGGNYYNLVSWNYNGTPTNGVKIKTNIPYTNGSQMPTIIIEGYDYGASNPIGILLNWYVYGGNIINHKASSYGATTPTIKLANEGGLVTIHLDWKPYYGRMTVRAYAQGMSEIPSWFNGWTVVDEVAGISSQVTVAYQNRFGLIQSPSYAALTQGIAPAITGAPNAKIFSPSGDYIGINTWGISYSQGDPDYINFQNSNSVTSQIALDNGAAHFGLGGGNVGIGTSTPSPLAKLEVNGQVKITGGTPGVGKVLTSDSSGLATWTTPTSATWYDGWVGNPGYDANTILPSKSGFSYSNNAPHTGPLVHFDAEGYGLQLSADYSGGGRGMSFRTRNGDAGVWNGWNRVLTDAGNTVWSVNQFGSNKGVSSYLGSNNTYGLQAFSNDGGAAAMSFHRGGYYAVNMGLDPDNVFRIGGWSAAANRWQLDMAGNQTVAGFMRAGSYLYTDQNYGYGLVGVYASTRYQGVYAMGDAYKLAPDGITPGNLYGIAWTHENVGGESKAGLGHQALFMMNGSTYTAIGNGIWTQGKITSLGTITAPGYLYSSDRSLKKDITPLSQSLENIKKLNGYSFSWKKDGRKDIGVIAQEVEKVFPDIVHMDTTGTRSVEYGNLVAPLIESTKELADMHDAQEKTIQAQQQEIVELKQELAELRRLIEKK